MIKKLIRGGITFVGLLAGYGMYLLFNYLGTGAKLYDISGLSRASHIIIAIAFVLLFGFIFFILTPAVMKLSSKISRGIEHEIRHLSGQDLIAGTVGLVVGLLIVFLMSSVFALITNKPLAISLNIAAYILFGYLGVVIAVKKVKFAFISLVNAKRSGQPKQKAKGANTAAPKILDTSVIIDGRIADIMKSGFIEGSIIIPEFVLVELRHIADSSDGLKRNRGRRGLDVLNRIQTEYGIEIYNTDGEKSLEELPEVDVKLLKLAQIMNGKVVTNDYNLNKVAVIKGVEVLNINELSNNLKPVVLPGEEMSLFLVKEGKEQDQAVAYLDDGTMIVVENGRKLIGKTIGVIVSSVLQTAAGRMIFAKPK